MKTVAFALCGSFCTFDRAFQQMEQLAKRYRILPIMSETAFSTDTRFGTAAAFRQRAEAVSGNPVLHRITDTEPIGPKALADAVVVIPCTGNTAAKLYHAVTDTAVTMAVKSALRVQKPVVLALASNDALGASFRNIGGLMNTKNIFFVPMGQDDPVQKPNSLVAHFELLPQTLEAAFSGRQLHPVLR